MSAVMHQELFRKARHSVQDLADGAGYLQPTQARRFLRLSLPETSMLRMVRIHPMQSPEEHVDKFRFATRVMRAASTETALTTTELATPQLSKQVLKAHLVKAEVQLPLETLEDNIEKEGYLQTILDGLAPRVGLDWEELVINGDTANAVDPYLCLFDGVYKQADQILYNHLGAAPNLDLWHKMIKLMPPEFQRVLPQGRFWTAFNVQHDWRANLAGRFGPIGDAALQSLQQVAGFGIPIVPVYNVRDDQVFNSLANHSEVLLCHPNNIVVGLYSGIRVFLDLDVRAGVWSIIIRFRTDAKLVEKTACVKGRNVLSGATSVRVGGSSTAELIPDDPVALSELGFTTTDETVGYDDGLTSFVPPADLGITAPVKFP
jgi:hypothetical protein